MRWVIEVTVELSLVEGIAGEGYHRSIVVWEGLKETLNPYTAGVHIAIRMVRKVSDPQVR